MKNKLLAISIALSCIFSLSACKQGNVANNNSEKSLYVIQSDPSQSDSKIIKLDSDLNMIAEKKVDVKSIAKGFKNIDSDGKNIYITTEFMNAYSLKNSKKILKYDTKKNDISYINTPLPLADTVSCDKESTYTTYNWNGKCDLFKIGMDGKKEASFTFDESGFSPYTKVIGNKLYVSYSKILSKSDRSAIYCFDKDTLKKEYSYYMDERDFMSANSIIKKGNRIFLVGGLNNSQKENGVMQVYDEVKKEYKSYKMDYKANSAFLVGDDIYIFTTETNDVSFNKGIVYKFDTKNDKLQMIKTLDKSFYSVERIGDRYVLVLRNKLYLLDDSFKIIKEIDLKNDYNLEIIAV